jgi:hypothetical protein
MTSLYRLLAELPAGHSLVVQRVGTSVRVSVTDIVEFSDVYYLQHRTLESDGASSEDAASRLLWPVGDT